MQIYRHIDDIDFSGRRTSVTLGNFDGIHVGHQALIKSAVADGRARGAVSVVLTFEPHPLKVLAPARAPQMLLQHKDKMQLMQSLGVDVVVNQHFDAGFAAIEAEAFVRRFLCERLGAARIWVGKDLRFGKGRAGDVARLTAWGQELGFTVNIVDPIMIQGARVSSSRIRELIRTGDVDSVEPLLGRYHFVSGKVVNGHRRGRELGFPTANIQTRTETVPLDGIYATLVRLHDRDYLSVSSIGYNPTFGAGPKTIESHILDFGQDIYGESVRLAFVKRLRGEEKFTSVEALVHQIACDVAAAKALFRERGLAS